MSNLLMPAIALVILGTAVFVVAIAFALHERKRERNDCGRFRRRPMTVDA